MVLPCYIHWQMLLPMCGRFKLCIVKADVVCLVLVICFVYGDLRLMLLPVIALADVIAMWQMVSH